MFNSHFSDGQTLITWVDLDDDVFRGIGTTKVTFDLVHYP
jgi:hypothetical protein